MTSQQIYSLKIKSFRLANVIIIPSIIMMVTILQVIRAMAVPKIEATPETIEAGRKLYDKRCSFCHGSEGQGNGPVAVHMDPKPRDFTKAEYKIRSTPWGSLPTDQDLFDIITRGMPGTAMPSWDILPEEQRWQLVYYIKSFSDSFVNESIPEKISFNKEVRTTSKTITQGQKHYQEMKCFLCHGDEGKSDGPITATLRYEWGFPFKAKNLTQGWWFRGGNSSRDIYRTLSTGLNGTPMGSYADYLSEEERWSLAHYVRSLSPEREPISEVVLRSRLIKGDLNARPDDQRWQKARPIEIALSGQIITPPRLWTPSTGSVTVRSLYNEHQIAFLLEWDDDSHRQDEVFQDGVAIQLPVKIPQGPQKPYFFMGQPGKSINIWQWKSQQLEETDNQNTQVLEFNAAGFKNITRQSAESQDVRGHGSWRNGRWRVVLIRPLTTQNKARDIQFHRGRLIPIAINVWDGSNREIGLQKAISSWYYLLLEASAPLSAYLYALIAVVIAMGFEWWLIRKVRKLPVELVNT